MSRRRSDDVISQMYGGNYKNAPERNRTTLYERMYLRILTEITTNRFTWTGMPEEIDLRFLELQLARQALCVFFYDNDYERYFALRGAGTGPWNMYDNPVRFNAIGNQMINRQLQAGKDYVDPKTGEIIRQKCVPIWANTMRTPDTDVLFLQSSKLAKTERTIEITLQNMRKTALFAVDDNERTTFVNLFKQVTEGEPVVYGSKLLGQNLEESVKMFDLAIDKEMVLNLQIAKAKIWNETMTLLGINNANQEKRERLVADEVSANDAQIESVRNSALGARQYAAEWINKTFPDLNVSVEWNENTSLEDDPTSIKGEQETTNPQGSESEL